MSANRPPNPEQRRVGPPPGQGEALTLAVAQCTPMPLDVAGNLARMQQLCAQAAAQGADAIVLPEMYLTGYSIGTEAVNRLAQERDGSWFEAVAHMAQAHQLAIVYGYPERTGAGVYNAAQCVSARGELLLNYRKTHLYGTLDRSQFIPAAIDDNASALTTLKGWRVGLLICYDVEFPENTRRLALAGADLVLVPTANMDRYDFVPTTMIPTRAFENQMALAYANYCGPEYTMRYGGLSIVADALGQPLAQAQRNDALLIARLDPAALQHARSEQTHLREYAQRLSMK